MPAMTPDPREVRWTPLQHYDAAVEELSEDRPPYALVHALLGILRQLGQASEPVQIDTRR